MGYDEVLEQLGDFGSYQKVIYLLLCLPAISCAFHKLVGVFLLAKPNFRCKLPFELHHDNVNGDNNYSNANESRYDSWPQTQWNLTYVFNNLTEKWDTCAYYDLPYKQFDYPFQANNVTLMENIQTVSCSEYVYDTSKYLNSAVTEWNLVCSHSFLAATSDSLFMFGVLLGSITFGHLSDKFGRKPIFMLSLLIQVIFGVSAGLAPDYITYTISRIIVGSTCSGVFLVAYVIAMEMVGPTKRLFAGVFIMMFFSLGFILTAAFAYFIPDWRHLQIALSLPGLIFLSYYWIVPESARWLLSNNRREQAVADIQKAAKFNKITLSKTQLDSLLSSNEKAAGENSSEKASIFDLFKYPNLRKKTLIIFFNWFVNSGTYYGLSWNSSNLGSNHLINFVISGAVEFPAYTFLIFSLNRWGRKTILTGGMLLAGCSLLLTAVVPANTNWLIITLAMVGKLAITASYGTIYIFSAEQFPTVVRNVGLGASSMVARIGGILAPFFNILSEIWKPLPLMIFGALALFGGTLALLLPETHNQATLETIEDGENLGKKIKKYKNATNARPGNGHLVYNEVLELNNFKNEKSKNDAENENRDNGKFLEENDKLLGNTKEIRMNGNNRNSQETETPQSNGTT